jgi:hypothetical protein
MNRQSPLSLKSKKKVVIGMAPDKQKIPIGRLVVTSTVKMQVPVPKIIESVERHITGEWGNVSEEDWKRNDDALIHGERIISSYHINGHGDIWVITEADRKVTTVLFPDEY